MKKATVCFVLFCGFIAFFLPNEAVAQQKFTDPRRPGGSCESCEILFVDMPKTIPSVVTGPGWFEPGQKLILSGTIFQPDGKTPAVGVVLYYWQASHKGVYEPSKSQKKESSKHGKLRGWIKTDSLGGYQLRTIRPGSYPGSAIPAHIHLLVLEPAIDGPYFIDDILFSDDPFLDQTVKKYPPENRGGSGVLTTTIEDGIQFCKRDIVLGLNIPGYVRRK